jgi:uncharacterized protein YdaU (DUF1376 family)
MKPPRFSFYARDWLAGTRRLSAAARGVYVDLLAWSWINGPVPRTVAEIAKIASTNERETRAIWEKLRRHHFTKCRSGYCNPRLERERAKSKAFNQLQAEKARRSWASRRSRGNAGAHAAADERHMLALASASASADLDQDLSSPADRPVFAPFKLYKAIAGCAMDEPPASGELGEITARMKTICARADIPCDGELARKAIDAVIVGRSKRRA